MTNQSILSHAKGYDPAQAHAYYLRTRKLKGRQSSGEPDVSAKSVSGKVISNIGGRTTATSVTAPVATDATASKQAAKERLAALEKRLDRLKDLLEKKVEEAKKRAGVDEPKATTKSSSSTSTSSGSSKSSGSDKKTTAELIAESKASREYYEKNKNKIANQRKQNVDQNIKEVQEQIKAIRAELKAVVEAARPKKKTATVKTKPRTEAVTVRRP